MKNHDDIIGYILKDPNTAVVDLNEPARISDYALFSSATNEAASKLSEIYDLGEIRHVIVEAKHMLMLSVDIGESRISVFMEKNVDVDNILNKLQEF